ncbi:MAG: glycoside hydrolase family 18 protein [Deltaproteobacteria bacterium]|nr:glycoside hydrolase family 18 protein [Deltaproteobacteria bacterium]
MRRLPPSSALPLLFLAACAGTADGGSGAGADNGTAVTIDSGTGTDVGRGDAGMTDGPPPPSGDDRVIGYYPAWATYARDFQVSEIPAGRLTHINYAFANIQNGGCVLGDPWADTDKTFPGDTWDESAAHRAGNFKQLRLLRQAHPDLRTLISVGGWTWSAQFSDAALTPTSRAHFAESCVDFMVEHGFDGIDIDWEYPVGGGLAGNTTRPEDEQNYTLLLAALRDELTARAIDNERAEAYLLTIAAPAGPSIIEHLESAAIAAEVDWINVMTYDFHGAFETTTGFNAPLRQSALDPQPDWNVEAALETYLAAGVPASQLAMGVPFYGRSWSGVSAGESSGLQRPGPNPGPGTWENGVLDYADIVHNYMGAGFVRHWDDAAQVPWLFNASTGVFITYDDPESLAVKRELADELGLGGIMIWDLSSDTASHDLLDAVR